MSERKIVYEPHPVAPERRAELIGQGFKILDAVFKPQDYESPEVKDAGQHEAGDAEPSKRRGRPPKE